MIHRYREGTVPRAEGSTNSPFDKAVRDAVATYDEWMAGHRLQEGARQFISVAGAANRYIEEQAPWQLAKQGKQRELDLVLANLARTVVRLAILAYPFIPGKAEAVWELVCPGLSLARTSLEDAVGGVEGRPVGKAPILFPKPRLASV